MVWACHYFRAYLIGDPVTVETDHQSLQWLMNAKKVCLFRWARRIAEFDVSIKYRAGKANGNADALSRCPQRPADDEWEQRDDERTDFLYAIGVDPNGIDASLPIVPLTVVSDSDIIAAHETNNKPIPVCERLITAQRNEQYVTIL